jgi:hypothetical protein
VLDLSFRAAKANFFDRAAVMNAVDAGRRRVLSKFGAFVRQRARTSIRKRKGISAVGAPPYSHVDILRKGILFAYDATRGSVVIGPARLGGTVDPDALPALEYGGPSTTTVRGGKGRKRISVRARPFMGPAFEAEKPGLPAMWKDSIR